jgi:aspartate kinase
MATDRSVVSPSPIVVKLGGSILTGLAAYRDAARFLARMSCLEAAAGLVAVVSAEDGHTDALRREALDLSDDPDTDALDLLWSTGEHRSVALLTLALRAEDVDALPLNAHQTGVRRQESRRAVAANLLVVRAALGRHRVVVAPGFLATCEQRVVTLGRGGSDWSAVILAAALGARSCVLVKDVDGYFTADPAIDRRARHMPRLTHEQAIGHAEAGCPLVQHDALVEAAAHQLPLVIRSLTGTGTLVTSDF